MKVFLSHSHRDRAFVRGLATTLRSYEVVTWVDEVSLLVGDSLDERIPEAVSEMDFLGVVLSPDSVGSEWVQREVKLAAQIEASERTTKVLPILLRPCRLPDFLRDKVYADFRDARVGSLKYSQGVAQLLHRISPGVMSVENIGRIEEGVSNLVPFLITLQDFHPADQRSNSDDVVGLILGALDVLDKVPSAGERLKGLLTDLLDSPILDTVLAACLRRFSDLKAIQASIFASERPWQSREIVEMELLVALVKERPSWQRRFGVDFFLTYLEGPLLIGDESHQALNIVATIGDSSTVPTLRRIAGHGVSGNEAIGDKFNEHILSVIDKLSNGSQV